MSLDVIHKIIEDLKLVSSLVPGGNEERKLAQERLDAIKGSPACLDIAQELIRYRSTPISLFYGLDLLMHCATTLQLSSANILSCLSLLHQQDPSYIKEKMAKVIVEFVKRVWPGAWSDFDAVFRAFYASEDFGREIVLLVYRNLVQDVFVYADPVASKRKLELSTSLLGVCVDAAFLNEWIIKQKSSTEDAYKIKTNLDMLVELVRNDPQNEGWMTRLVQGCTVLVSQDAHQHKKLVLLHLETIEAFLNWIPTSAILHCRALYFLLDLLLSTLDAAVASLVLDSLLTLCSRNFPPLDTNVRKELFWTPFFGQGYLARLITLYGAWHNQASYGNNLAVAEREYVPVSEEHYFLCNLGSAHICFKKNVNLVPEGFEAYLELVLLFADHPSAFCSGWALDFLFDAVRHDATKTVLFKDAVATSVLNRLAKGLGGTAPTSAAFQAYSSLDFDSKKDESLALAHNNLRRVEIVRLITAGLPLIAFGWIHHHLPVYFTNPAQAEYDIVQLSQALECILASLPAGIVRDAKQRNDSLVQGIGGLLEGILSLDSQDVHTVSHQLPMLASFSPMMDLFPELLFRCMEKFFALSAFTQPHEASDMVANVVLSDATILVRRKAASCLVKLGTSMPDIFIPIIDKVAPAILGLTTSGRLLKTESRILIEFLIVAITGSSLDNGRKKELVAAVVLDDFNELDQFVGAFEAGPSKFYGILAPQPYSMWDQSADGSLTPAVLDHFEKLFKWRQSFINLLLSFRHWIRRSAEIAKKTHATIDDLWEPYIPKLFSLALSLIK
ncbi:hypothetical protein HDU91_005805 [Kappamyces sp. JEL0680]|nr:hypothetical protein HDU91_005805 [Kappamyces sp. JEL0680]